MPNFDGTGPIRRGWAIGRGPGHCKKGNECSPCQRKDAPENTKEKPDTP
ncbi:MAG: DUF5320 family protein [Methanoregula sp.]|nr:DUF5320 family protein [Methanoregula sp.]